jgi:lysophospholipase L1-like esterase
LTPTPNSRVVRTATRVAVLAVLASLTPMYFDRWHRGMVVVGAVTAVAVALAGRLTAAPPRARWRSWVHFVALALPAIVLLRGVEATILHLGWSMLLVVAFARGTRWPRVLAINVVLGISLFSIYEYSIRARDLGRRTAEMGWNLAPPAPGDPWVEWRNSEWMSWRDDTDSITRSWRLPSSSPAREARVVAESVTRRPDGRLELSDYGGFFIRVVEGRRVTTSGVSSAPITVHVFGGSAIACLEVLDHETIPSLVAANLNQDDRRYRVVNHGIPGARAIHQLAAVRALPALGKSDVVVFYDGGNDAWETVESLVEEQQSASLRRFVQRGLELVERRSRAMFVAFLSDRVMWSAEDQLDDEIGSSLARTWRRPVEVARSHVERQGARFIHVLQPNLFTYDNAGAIGSSGSRIARVFRQMRSGLSGRGDYDFTEIFDGSSASPYLDWVHLTAAGNRIVAEEIADVITDR